MAQNIYNQLENFKKFIYNNSKLPLNYYQMKPHMISFIEDSYSKYLKNITSNMLKNDQLKHNFQIRKEFKNIEDSINDFIKNKDDLFLRNNNYLNLTTKIEKLQKLI